jgi:hypothetical protein
MRQVVQPSSFHLWRSAGVVHSKPSPKRRRPRRPALDGPELPEGNLASENIRIALVDRWVRRHPVIVIAVLASFLISSFLTISTAVSGAASLLRETVSWRDREYERIDSIRSGMSIGKITEILGQPLFVRRNLAAELVESTFSRRGYWVQTLHNEVGATELIAITSCDPTFKPRINSVIGPIVLNESSYADSVKSKFGESLKPLSYRYFLGNTRPSYLYDEYSFGNPGLYKTFIVGINDACPTVAMNIHESGIYDSIWCDTPARAYSRPDRAATVEARNQRLDETMRFGLDESCFDAQALSAFRSHSVVNTYAEATGGFLLGKSGWLHIGVDRYQSLSVPTPVPTFPW